MDNVSRGTLATLDATLNADGERVLRISGELDISSVPGVEADLMSAMHDDGVPLVFDLADLAFMDSSGIAMLLRAADKTGPITIRGASPTVRQIIQVTGLDEILRVQP